jgi:hypothetical protein
MSVLRQEILLRLYRSIGDEICTTLILHVYSWLRPQKKFMRFKVDESNYSGSVKKKKMFPNATPGTATKLFEHFKT